MCSFDSTLTAEGQAEVRAASAAICALPEIDALVVSPLTRALQTADIAFAKYEGRRLVHHLATERLEHSSDVSASPLTSLLEY